MAQHQKNCIIWCVICSLQLVHELPALDIKSLKRIKYSQNHPSCKEQRKGVLEGEHVQYIYHWSYFDLAIIRKPHIPDAQLSIC